MKRWLDLSHDKPWDRPKRDPNRKIDPSEYMQSGWNDCPPGAHPYKKGSRHNKIGMWIMWIFYVIVIAQVVYALSVIPFWPITAMMGVGLLFGSYVVVSAKKNGR